MPFDQDKYLKSHLHWKLHHFDKSLSMIISFYRNSYRKQNIVAELLIIL